MQFRLASRLKEGARAEHLSMFLAKSGAALVAPKQ